MLSPSRADHAHIIDYVYLSQAMFGNEPYLITRVMEIHSAGSLKGKEAEDNHEDNGPRLRVVSTSIVTPTDLG